MPREVPNQVALIEVVKNLPLTAEMFDEEYGKQKYSSDLDVTVRGSEYGNGKRVGPYMQLLTYDAGKVIMQQGDWGGNTFYIAVSGMLDVLINDVGGGMRKISQLPPGICFGEMALLAGVERN